MITISTKEQHVSAYTRMNISLPAEVKARMDAQTDPPNWSNIATHAFLNYLDNKSMIQRVLELEAQLAMTRGALRRVRELANAAYIDAIRHP